MAFDQLIRDAVGLADDLTASLQATVVHEPYSGQDEFGKRTYAAAVERQAVVERRVRSVPDASGAMVLTAARITFLRPVAVDPRDRLTLPDGETGPIVDTEGLFDPDAAGGTYLTEVWIGRGGR